MHSVVATDGSALQQSAELVVDVVQGRLVRANEAGRALWVGAAGGCMPALPLTLDAAMPALMRLRAIAGELSGSGPVMVPLTWWTAAGVIGVNGHISVEAGDAAIVVRVVAEPRPAASAQVAASEIHKAVSAQELAEEERARVLRHLAHELRTPLAAIASLAEALHGGYLGAISNDRQLDYLESIRDTARHTLDVVEDMLATRQKATASKGLGETGVAGPGAVSSDVADVVEGVIDSMAELAGRSQARLRHSVASGLPPVAASPTALKQMLINLVANALTHGGPHAVVHVCGAIAGDGLIGIEVTDTGRGIPADVIADVATGRPAASGRLDVGGLARPSGLGLQVTRTLAQAAGGDLQLVATGSGTTARVLLPVAQRTRPGQP